MKKKILSAVLSAAMVASMLVGCGAQPAATQEAAADTKAEASTDAAAPAASSEGGNKLTVFAWDPNFNIPALEAAAADYKANGHDDFELEIIVQSGSSDVESAVTLAGSSGDYSNLPDIVLFQDHWIQKYHRDYPDAFVSLEGADVNWSDFGAEKISYSTIDGQHYGMPVDNGTAIFAYRTDILAECGYTMADVTGITWDRFTEIGEEVYAKTGKHLLSMDGDGNDLIYLMLQAEGESQWKDGVPTLVGNPKVVSICEKIVDMAKKNVLYLANDWSDYTDQTIIGDMVAGVCNGNWIIPTMEQVADNSGKWEITTMPTLDGHEGYASNGGSSLYITANCKNTDLAKDFLAKTFGSSSQTYDESLLKGGVIGCYIPAGQSDVYQQGVDFFNGQAIYSTIVEMGGHVPTIEQSDYHYTLRTYMAAAIINARDGADLMTELQAAEDQTKFEIGG